MINPIIFRIGSKKNWNNKFIYKKSIELKIYILKQFELKTFIYIFFQKYGLNINFINTFYKKYFLHIFIIYYISNYNKINQLSLHNNGLNKNKNMLVTLNFSFLKLKNYFINSYLFKIKQIILKVFFNLNILKRLSILKIFSLIKIKFFNIKKTIYLNKFFNKLFNCLTLYLYQHKFFKITLKQLNNNYIFKNYKTIKKQYLTYNIINLRKFETYNFFFETINFIIYLLNLKFKSKALFKFINNKLKTNNKFNKLNLLLKLLEILLFNFVVKLSFITSIKILLKGILTKNKRSSKKTIIIGSTISNTTINKSIDFNQAFLCTNKGTFGVKLFFLHETKKRKN